MRVQIKFPDQGLTKQSHKDECDINQIMQKYQATGVLAHIKTHEPSYGFATSDTYFESLQVVAQANTMFEELPSSVRKKFKNDPALFLDYVQDPENADSLRDMGLLNPEPDNPPKKAKKHADEPKKAPSATKKDDPGKKPAEEFDPSD